MSFRKNTLLTRSCGSSPQACRGASAFARAGAPIPRRNGKRRAALSPALFPRGPRRPAPPRGAAKGVLGCALSRAGARAPGAAALLGCLEPKHGWDLQVGEAALSAGLRSESLRCLDGARTPGRCAQSRATHWTPQTPGANSAESATASLRPNTAATQRPQPNNSYPTRVALRVRLFGSGLASHGLCLRFRLRLGPQIQLRLQQCAQLGCPLVRYIAPRKVQAASARPAPPAAAAARRPRGRRGHGPGRREGGRGSEALAWTSGEGRRAVLRARGPGLPRGAVRGRRGSPAGSEAGERGRKGDPGHIRTKPPGSRPGLCALFLTRLRSPPGTPGAQEDLGLTGSVWSFPWSCLARVTPGF